MKNKSVNMKKLIATPFLFCLSLFTFRCKRKKAWMYLSATTERKERKASNFLQV